LKPEGVKCEALSESGREMEKKKTQWTFGPTPKRFSKKQTSIRESN